MGRSLRGLTTACAFGAAAVLGACTTAGTPAESVTVDESFTVAGGKFSTGGGINVAVDVREIGGKVGVCGAWTTTPQSVRSQPYNRDVLSAASVRADGVRLVQNLTFMARAPEGSRLSGRRAPCVVTDTAWQGAPGSVTVSIPRRIFDHDDSGEGEATAAVRFRQTEPAAGVL